MKNFINEIIDSYSDALNEIIGYIDYDLILNFEPFIYLSTSEESGLLNLITDAIRDKGKGEINIITGEKIGKGELIYKNGSKIIGTFYKNEPYGWNIYINEEGILYIGLFKNGNLNGKEIIKKDGLI